VVQRGSVRRYPRMVRVNEVVREVVADELERLSDPRLGLVTVTGVDVSNDLRHATVYYSALDAGREQPKRSRRGNARPVAESDADADVDATTTAADAQSEFKAQTQAALRSAAPHLRTALGRQVRLKYVPELTFREDPAIEQGERVEAIIREIHSQEDQRRDTE
jgi:ribosome-binding factor A